MAASDQKYIIDLCDKVLRQKAKREFRFSFLLEDPNKSGRRAKLPVDAFYPKKNLVIEYYERQHTEAVKFFDKRKTISGVSRDKQRRKYDLRRKRVLFQYGIKLIILKHSDFECKSNKRLCRLKKDDVQKIKTLL